MTDDRDVIQELGALLDLEPSAAFAAHVRNAIERDRPRRFSWRLMAVAAMGVVLVGVVLSLAIRRSVPAPPASRTWSTVTAPVQPPGLVLREARGTEKAPRLASKPRVPAVEEIVDLSPVVARVDGVDVIVPADQRLALARLVAGIRGGRVIVPPGLPPQYDQDGRLLPIAPVVIAAIPNPVAPIDANDINGGSTKSPGEKR